MYKAEQKMRLSMRDKHSAVDPNHLSKKQKKSEKSKTILSWEHVIDKIKISSNSDHDWLANGYNISRDFREFQINTIERLKKNPTLSYATDVDEILVSLVYNLRKEEMPKYINCTNQVWKDALHRL
ncbi:unnamed protein product [Rhizophagus irregularis]|nr:unnamed protein product [Rhizophagus irregularis]